MTTKNSSLPSLVSTHLREEKKMNQLAALPDQEGSPVRALARRGVLAAAQVGAHPRYPVVPVDLLAGTTRAEVC
jgi:hypothetical protein